MEYLHAFLIAIIVFFGMLTSYQRGRASRNADIMDALKTLGAANATNTRLLATMATIERQRDEAIAGWQAAQR